MDFNEVVEDVQRGGFVTLLAGCAEVGESAHFGLRISNSGFVSQRVPRDVREIDHSHAAAIGEFLVLLHFLNVVHVIAERLWFILQTLYCV